MDETEFLDFLSNENESEEVFNDLPKEVQKNIRRRQRVLDDEEYFDRHRFSIDQFYDY